jgi:hypothetical protein
MELTKRATFGVVTWVFIPVRREEIDLAFQAKKNTDHSGTLLSGAMTNCFLHSRTYRYFPV